MALAARTGGKVKDIGQSGFGAIPECDRPESIDGNDLAIISVKLAEETAGGSIEGVDRAISEVADQYRISEGSEFSGRNRDSPRRIQRSARGDPPDEIAVGIEYVYESITGTGHIVMLRGVLQSKGDVEFPAQVGDIEGRVACGKIGVGERPSQRDLGEATIVNVDVSGVEVRRIEMGRATAKAERYSFVHGAGSGVVNGDDGRGGIRPRIPSGDRAVFRDENEHRVLTGLYRKSHERIENSTCWR